MEVGVVLFWIALCLPALIGIANLDIPAAGVGALFVALAVWAGIELGLVAGGTVWVVGCTLAVAIDNKRSQEREDRRHHNELVAAIRGGGRERV